MSGPIANLSEPLERVECAVVVMDLVESVRLMQDHESTTIQHWLHFTRSVRERLAPALCGRVVKSLGDGMLLTFTSCANAADFALQAISQLGAVVQALPAAQRLALRIGAHWTSVVVDECDIFGSGVNLSARLAAQSQPNEVLVSCEFAEQLLDGVQGQLTDLGERFFKHLSEPVRVLLLGPRAPEPAMARETSLLPTLAFLPLHSSLADQTMARVLDDHFVSMMATVPHWGVMSRLSTASLAATRTGLTAAPSSVQADLLFAARSR